MYTADVKNLFPSVDQFASHMICLKWVKEYYNIQPKTAKALNSIMYDLRNSSFFEYNGKLYKQTKGLYMGSPMSPVLAEMYLQKIEEEFIIPVKNHFITYVRYVDDIFFICKENDATALSTFSNITEKYPNISFTLEKEKNKRINYLDVSIDHVNKKPVTTVYHKSTGYNIIPARSYDFQPYKNSAIQYYFRRAKMVCSTSEELENECKWVEQLASQNGYTQHHINKIKTKIFEPNINENKLKTKWKYIGSLPYTAVSPMINRYISKYNLRIAANKGKNIFSRIRTDKDKGNSFDYPGIYEIPVETEGEFKSYVGSTTRPIKTRIQEHKNLMDKAILTNTRVSSTLVNLVRETELATPYWHLARVITIWHKRESIKHKEAIEIIKRKSLNQTLPVYTPYTWIALINQSIANTKT